MPARQGGHCDGMSVGWAARGYSPFDISRGLSDRPACFVVALRLFGSVGSLEVAIDVPSAGKTSSLFDAPQGSEPREAGRNLPRPDAFGIASRARHRHPDRGRNEVEHRIAVDSLSMVLG